MTRATEFEQFRRLLGSEVLFSVNEGATRLVGRFVGIGEHFLFFEDVRQLNPYGVEEYLTGKIVVDENVRYKIGSGAYNKLDIYQIHPYSANPSTVPNSS